MAYQSTHYGSASHRLSHRAFTLIEILVVVSIIAILIAILIPALAAAKAESETVACLANQRTIAQSLVMFAHQHNGYMVKGQNNGYGTTVDPTASDGAYMGAPQIWGYGSSTASPALNWDQVLVVDKYVTFGVLQDPADTQDSVGNDNLRYPSTPTPIASAQPYENLPGSYRLNASNQPEDYNPNYLAGAYESPMYNAYAIASVNAPSQSIVICDGGYDTAGGWKTTADVATWAVTGTAPGTYEAFSSPKNPNTPTATDSAATASTSNINTTIHSGEMNVAFLDGHCQTMKWPDTWAPAGQPTIVPGKTNPPVWNDGGTAPFTTGWRQVFSPDAAYQDHP